MLRFAYTFTPQLKNTLDEIEELRTKILTSPLSHRLELKLRWESLLDRIYYSLLESGSTLKRKEISERLTASALLRRPKKITLAEKNILKYKKALDIISFTFLGSEKSITPKAVFLLHEVGCPGTFKKNNNTEFRQALEYLESNTDHPVIQAAIAYSAIITLKPFTDGNGRLARLLSLAFLYKGGFDVRGMICIEKEWYKDKDRYKQALEHGVNSSHITLWMEYFAESLVANLRGQLQEIQKAKTATQREKSFIYLNERQKEILSILDEPSSTITNRLVQKHFRISQITASRDLSHLAALALLAPRGKGRSIHYTKA
jgi:hypothetical protein